MPWAAAAISGASAIGGFAGSKKQADAERHRWSTSLDLFRRGRSEQTSYLNRAQGQMEGLVPYLNRQYSLARADLAGAGNAARRDALTQQTRALGGAQQSLASRGLFNSSVLEGARRGIGYDTTRALADIDERIGSMFAGLRTQQAGAVGGAKQNLANFYGQRGATALDTAGSFINLYQGTAPQQPNPWAAVGAFNNAMTASGGYANLFSGKNVDFGGRPVDYSGSKVK